MRLLLGVMAVAGLVAACGGAERGRADRDPAPPSNDPRPALALTPRPPPGSARPAPPVRLHRREDLEALERQHAWDELVEHLEDIAPSERDERWKAMTAHAVVAYLEAERASARRKVDLVRLTEALARRYPSLLAAGPFLAIRGEIIVSAIDACTSEDRSWDRCELLAGGLEADPKHALAGAQTAAAHGHRALAMTLFRIAGAADPRSVCANDQALATMVEGISEPAGSRYHQDAQALQERCRATKK